MPTSGFKTVLKPLPGRELTGAPFVVPFLGGLVRQRVGLNLVLQTAFESFAR